MVVIGGYMGLERPQTDRYCPSNLDRGDYGQSSLVGRDLPPNASSGG